MINEPNNLEEKDDSIYQVEQEEIPQKKMSEIMESLELLAMQKGGKSSLDFSTLNSNQIDKVLETMDKNESNAFAYHTKKLEVIQSIRFKELETGVTEHTTNRWVKIGLIVAAFIVTILILLLKSEFFIPWITFITGIFGGLGLSRTGVIDTSKKTETTLDEDDL